jgi:hypothetical protein
MLGLQSSQVRLGLSGTSSVDSHQPSQKRIPLSKILPDLTISVLQECAIAATEQSNVHTVTIQKYTHVSFMPS